MIKRLITVILPIVFVAFVFALKDISAKENSVEFQKVQSNMYNLKNDYNEVNGTKWNPTRLICVESVFDENLEDIGYVACFDEGYMAYKYDNQILHLSTTNDFNFNDVNKVICYQNALHDSKNFNKNDYIQYKDIIFSNSGPTSTDIYHHMYDEIGNDGFNITSCCTYLPDSLDSKHEHYGAFNVICFSQDPLLKLNDDTDCGVLATMNLLATYDYTGLYYITYGQSVKDMRLELRKDTNWANNPVHQGMLPIQMMHGCNKYIDEHYYRQKFRLSCDTLIRLNKPRIGVYSSLDVKDTGHFALKVGTAKQKYGDLFWTYWDIIVSWGEIINGDIHNLDMSKNIPKENYYLVDYQYCLAYYSLYPTC